MWLSSRDFDDITILIQRKVTQRRMRLMERYHAYRCVSAEITDFFDIDQMMREPAFVVTRTSCGDSIFVSS